MTIKIKSSDLKTATKLTTRVKDVKELGAQTSYWRTVHRLIASPQKLRLLTTDSDTYLDWSIDLESTDGDEFDILVPAVQLNDMAKHAFGEVPIEINADADSFTLVQKGDVTLTQSGGASFTGPDRVLRMRTEKPSASYPDTLSFTGCEPTKWRTKAEPLAQSLAFMSSYIGGEVDEAKTVVTWTTDGRMLSGAQRIFAFVEGLGVPPINLNLKETQAKPVAAFLQALKEDVEIEVAGTVCSFRCPSSGHTLVISTSSVGFKSCLDYLEVADHEIFSTDKKTILSSVNALEGLVPRGKNYLHFFLSGNGGKSSLHLSTPLDPEFQSSDVVSLASRRQSRRTEEAETTGERIIYQDGSFGDTSFKVPCETFKDALSGLDVVSLDFKYTLEPRRRKTTDYLRIYGVPGKDEQLVKSLLILVYDGVMGDLNLRQTNSEAENLLQANDCQPATPPEVDEVDQGDVHSTIAGVENDQEHQDGPEEAEAPLVPQAPEVVSVQEAVPQSVGVNGSMHRRKEPRSR